MHFILVYLLLWPKGITHLTVGGPPGMGLPVKFATNILPYVGKISNS